MNDHHTSNGGSNAVAALLVVIILLLGVIAYAVWQGPTIRLPDNLNNLINKSQNLPEQLNSQGMNQVPVNSQQQTGEGQPTGQQ